MPRVRPWRQEIRAQARLAVPVIVVQVGLMAMGAVDGLFMGRVSSVAFASVAIGHTWTFIFLAFGMGTLTGLDPLVSQAWGARDLPAIGRALQRGLVFALALSVVLVFAIWPADRALTLLDQPPAVVLIATSYARIIILSVPAFLVFVALRHSLQAMHILRPLVIVILATNALNAFLDWVLIFGHLGSPALGAIGSAWGTVIARWAMVVAVLFLAGPQFRRFLWPPAERLLRPVALWRMLRIGLPVGVQFMVEIGAFSAVAVLMGTMGENELAGHSVAMYLASGSFMIPLGISMAAAVRVGNEVGAGNESAVRRAAIVALCGGAGVMVCFGALFLLAPHALARIFTSLDPVLAVAVLLIPLAGLFQVFDGTQVIAVGIMRGMADTRVPMLIHVLVFWGIGLPIGYVLAFHQGRGASGLWWGLVVGLAVVAALQFLRLRGLIRRGIRRVVIDETDVGSPGSPAPPGGGEASLG